MIPRKFVLAAILLSLLCGTTLADFKKIAEASWWSVIEGIRNDGTPFCAMISRTPYGTGNIVIAYTKGASSYEIILTKHDWAIPDGTRGSVVIRFGYRPPWKIATIASGRKLRGEIPMQNIDVFMSGFQAAGRIDVTFTAGNEPPWEFATGGGGIIEPDFAKCIFAQNPRKPPPPTQPY